jgi:hypothetical protein
MATKQINVRLDEDLIQRARDRAKTEGVSLTDIIIEGIVSVLGSYEPTGPPPVPPDPLADAEYIKARMVHRMAQAATTTAAHTDATSIHVDCIHPKPNRVSLGYATKCGLCDEIIR